MLGSGAEADDAVQEAWLRLARSDAAAIENLRAWLTTVVGRVCLNALRARAARREEPAQLSLADPVVSRPDEAPGPEEQALLADAVGVALLVVLDTLDPPERLAFVLHDLFAVPFEEIAPMVGRSPQAARQLASRARRRVRGAAGPTTDDVVAGDDARRRAVVEAFFAAARGGDFDGLLALLAPDAVLRVDAGAAIGAFAAAGGIRAGADAIARQALRFANPRSTLHPVLVNGTTGVVVTVGGQPAAVMAFTVLAGQIVAIDAWSGPDRLRSVDLGALAR
jgi:RNA polymerase sigma-70 factor (ECF subfamily)